MTNIQQTRKPAPSPGNPMGWPEELLPLFQRAITVEYASLTRAGTRSPTPLRPTYLPKGRWVHLWTGKESSDAKAQGRTQAGGATVARAGMLRSESSAP